MAEAVVLGAAGFIGRHACLALAQAGYVVHGIGHGAWTREGDWSRWGVSRWSCTDITLDSLSTAIGSAMPEIFVHCAGGGAVAQSYAAPLDDFHRSVASTVALLELVRQRFAPSARVVITSSAAVYGDQGDVDLTEMAVRSPVSPYGFHKLAAEHLCDSYSRFFGVDVSVVRLFSVYGEGLRKQLLWDALNKLSRNDNEFFGTGNEVRDWIHVADAAELLCAAARAPRTQFEIYNGGHIKASTRDLLVALAKEFGYDQPLRFSGQTHTGNPRRLTAECGHARRQLGWQPRIGLAQGLARYVNWFGEQRHASR